MAPASKKGTGPKARQNDRPRSASRHSTPVSALTDSTAPPTPLTSTPHNASNPTPNVPKETAYLHTQTAALLSSDPSIEQLIAGTTAKGSEPPSSKELNALHDKIRDTIDAFMGRRGEICDRSMRLLAQKRKERLQAEREAEAAARETAERKEAEERKKVKKEKPKALVRKRSHEEMEVDGEGGKEAEEERERERAKRRESLPSVGAHGLARQDGVGVHEGELALCSVSTRFPIHVCLVAAAQLGEPHGTPPAHSQVSIACALQIRSCLLYLQ